MGLRVAVVDGDGLVGVWLWGGLFPVYFAADRVEYVCDGIDFSKCLLMRW